MSPPVRAGQSAVCCGAGEAESDTAILGLHGESAEAREARSSVARQVVARQLCQGRADGELPVRVDQSAVQSLCKVLDLRGRNAVKV